MMSEQGTIDGLPTVRDDTRATIERLKAEAAQARTGEQLDDIKSRIDRKLSSYRGLIVRERLKGLQEGARVRIRDSGDPHPGSEGRMVSITEERPGEIVITVGFGSCTHTYSPEQLMPLEGLEHGNEESPEVRTYFTDLFEKIPTSIMPSYGNNPGQQWHWKLDTDRRIVDMLFVDHNERIAAGLAEVSPSLVLAGDDSNDYYGTGMEELIKAIGPGKRVKRSVIFKGRWYIELEDDNHD